MAREETGGKQATIDMKEPAEAGGVQPTQDLSRRRIPCAERRVSGIRPGDVRVRITGTVIDRSGDRIVVDDGTGRITASFDRPVSVELNQMVRVLGRVIPQEGGFELQADILQDMSSLDTDLYRKVSDALLPGDEKDKKP